MGKTAVVYWSGTGNTKMMAQAIAQGCDSVGAETDVFYVRDFTKDMMDEYDMVIFGCPSMGVEELEDSEFQPVFDSCKEKLNGKKVALFGSYGWGDGEWMRNWVSVCEENGAVLADDYMICNGEPDEDTLEECREFGKNVV